jgi:hypothetical protein
VVVVWQRPGDRRVFAPRAWQYGNRSRQKEEKIVQNKRMLRLGLNALARAHSLDYFADGHRGAAMVAAYLFCKDNALNKDIRQRIDELIDMKWSGSPLCADFPPDDPQPERIQEIGQALREGSETLRQVGHNAIFAMLAVKGFLLLPEAATPSRVDGVRRLIRMFRPWRDIAPDSRIQPPPFGDTVAVSRFILLEAFEAIGRFRGFNQGYAGHVLTFGQALVELAAMGYEPWAESCRTAFRKYLTVTRLGPDTDERAARVLTVSGCGPTDTVYWKGRNPDGIQLGHIFKYSYSFYDLLRRADDRRLEDCWKQRIDLLF